jgi:dienelactone hydrolase
MDIVLFHSVHGLRSAEIAMAGRWRAAGHSVVTPDLYQGRTAAKIAEGFALAETIGWPLITARAREAVRAMPENAVLAGISMGTSVVEDLLPDRPRARGVLLLHGVADIPATIRQGLPVQAHVADPDEYFPPDRVAAWGRAARGSGAELTLFRYPESPHFFTDPGLPGYDEAATGLVWQRSLDFLGGLA